MFKPVTFKNKGQTLVGILHKPDGLKPGEKTPGILMLHGFTGNKTEAHRLFVLGPENVLVRAFQETRKFGYGFWALNQLPSQIPLEVYQLVGFLIFLPGPKEYVDELASLALLSEDDRDFLLFGIRGTGIVVRQGDPRPRRLRLAIREEAIIR